MHEVVRREMLVPNLHVLTVRAPDVAEQIQPGQFVILRSHEDAERIPLSVADWDRETGELTLVFMEVGQSTGRMARLKAGDTVPTVVGPLGKPTEAGPWGTVLCVAGCYGIGSIYPVVRALRERGNTVVVAVEGRSHFLLYWEDRLRQQAERVLVFTRDGSVGNRGHVKRIGEVLQETGIVPQRVIVNGCTFLLCRTSRDLAHLGVPVIVNLNPIMIDGTGMCGVCRVSVAGKTRFACVDGPDFDGREVDWDELLKRRKQYLDEEIILEHHSGCGGGAR